MPFSQEGPALEALLHRMADFPDGMHTGHEPAALLHDLLLARGAKPDGERITAWRQRSGQENHALLPLLCWLLDAPEFHGRPLEPETLWKLLTRTSPQLAAQASARQFLTDPDRREELVRLALADLGMRPSGESITQAQDRLSSISSLERARVLEASRAAETRAREIREALRRKAAEEGADKWARE